jgi:hypothetical protein
MAKRLISRDFHTLPGKANEVFHSFHRHYYKHYYLYMNNKVTVKKMRTGLRQVPKRKQADIQAGK